MDQRSIKPGRLAADLAGKVHPRTGELITPLGYTKHGVAIWPVLGADDNDDPDDSRFTGEDDDADDDDSDDDDDDSSDDDDDDEDDKRKTNKKTKNKKDDDDDDGEDSRLVRASRQAAKYRTQLRAEQAKTADLESRLRKLERKGKPADQVAKAEADDAKDMATQATQRAEKLEQQNRGLALQVAFLTVTLPDDLTWVDPEDALALAERNGLLEDVIDDDGTVDRKALRRALRDLAKNKPHLVKSTKASGRRTKSDDNDDEDSDDGQESSAPKMNGKRKGERKSGDRAALAKRFPVLQQVTPR